jgi:hypothetical protein
MEPPVVLKLTLEHMQWQIMQAIYPREVELKERIEQVVSQAIDSFDFQAEIERQVAQELRNLVRRKVEYGVMAALNREKREHIDKIIEAEVERQLREQKR